MALLNKGLFGNILNNPNMQNQLGGLLQPKPFNPLLNIGLSLLKAGGPSKVPNDFLTAIGSAGEDFMKKKKQSDLQNINQLSMLSNLDRQKLLDKLKLDQFKRQQGLDIQSQKNIDRQFDAQQKQREVQNKISLINALKTKGKGKGKSVNLLVPDGKGGITPRIGIIGDDGFPEIKNDKGVFVDAPRGTQIAGNLSRNKGISFTTNKDGTMSFSMGGDDQVKLRPGEVIKTDSAGNKRIEKIEGADIQTREQAATGQSIKQGVKFSNEFIHGAKIPNAKTGEIIKVPGFLNKDGSINWWSVGSAHANLPWTDGKTHRRRLLEMIQGKLRAETGAAAPHKEVINLMERFMPRVTDSPASIHDKLNSLKNFSSEFLARTDPKLYRSLRTIALKNKGMKDQKAIDSIISKEMRSRGGGDLSLKEKSKDINAKARSVAGELRKKFPNKSKQEIIDMTRKQLGL